MISFYPGPSKVYPPVAEWAAEAVRSGIVSMNHRSPEFMAVTESAIRGLHEKLSLPAHYHVVLVSSATECWEIVAQSLTVRHSFHPYRGAFGQKWMEYARRIKPVMEAQTPDVVCVVQNETSNGTQVSMTALAQYEQEYPDAIVAVDAVSSMAGIAFDWPLADVWFASVQKCFGLPAGLAVLIYSPRALTRAEAIDDRNHYNSLLFLHENFSKFQTPYTPNGLGIYLLAQVMKQVLPIAGVDAITKRRAADWYAFFEQDMAGSPFSLLIDEADQRSDTVIAVMSSEAHVEAIKTAAKQVGLLLGNGYGDWKNTTFRIANFPAISDEEIDTLKNFLRNGIY